MTADTTARTTPATDLREDRPDGALPALAEEAVGAAEAAAAAAGLQVRSLSALADLRAVQRLYEQIWRPAGTSAPVTTELLRALGKAGSYVGGAFSGTELVGTCIGFFGAPDSAAMHSHIAGVSPRARGRSTGFALKAHQRAWALLRGIREISWTFDPLVARNAYFNIGKLAAAPAEYLPNFYGPMNDGINAGDDTDRLLVSWRLDSAPVAAACGGRHRQVEPGALRDGVPALVVAPSGAPHPAPRPGARTLLVAVPPDIERMRSADPGLARAWRTALRDVLGGLLADGARVRGFDRGGWYVVDTVPDREEEQ
jgi:predicted GNAT superfamily acetyltransferase